VEEIKNYTNSVEGFLAPTIEMLLILKIYTCGERQGTNKGRKDAIDIFSLIEGEKIDWEKYKNLVTKYKFEKITDELRKLLFSTDSVPELNISNHQMAKMKNKILSKI